MIILPNFKYPIDCSSLKEYARIGDDAVNQIVMTGFACATVLTQELIEAALIAPGIPEDIRQEWQALKPGPVIAIVSEYSDLLTEEEKIAILYHEQGHIDHDHFSSMLENGTEVGHGIFHNLQYEFEADDYAIAMGCKAVDLANAILKSLRLRAKIEAFGTGADEGVCYNAYQDCPEIKPRLSRLAETARRQAGK